MRTNIRHIIPDDDTYAESPHTFTLDCRCGPTLTPSDDTRFGIHQVATHHEMPAQAVQLELPLFDIPTSIKD